MWPTIIVVEDEAPMRRLLKTVLAAQGYLVFPAESGRRGQIEAGTRKPDLVILDLGLPDLDGIEVIGICARGPASRSSFYPHAIRKRKRSPPSTPVPMITSQNPSGLRSCLRVYASLCAMQPWSRRTTGRAIFPWGT